MKRGEAIFLMLALASPALAQAPALATTEAPGRPGRAAIYSADRRFMVSGMTSAENMVMARKLSEEAVRIEEKTGMPLPIQRDQVLGVMVQDSSAPDSQVLQMQGWDAGHFYQRLVVPGTLRLDEEDLLESACWLMLNRYAAEYTPEGQRVGLGATVPDWISSGLAQNTQAALRARNRDWIARELGEGQPMSLAQVVKQEHLPPGRWREKAYAAAAVEFLFPDGNLNAWAPLFKAVGMKQPVDTAWLRHNCAALKDQNPEEAWKDFLAQRARARTVEAWSDQGLQIEEKLLQTLNFRPRDLEPKIPVDVPQELFARDLIDYRSQSWVPSVAAALSLQVQSLELGAPPALHGVLAAYATYFDQFNTPPPEKHAWWQQPKKKDPKKIQPPDDGTWQMALNQLWMRAERAHQEFLENNQSRKRYVDSYDAPVTGGIPEPAPADTDIPRTAIQMYMDKAEERLEQSSP